MSLRLSLFTTLALLSSCTPGTPGVPAASSKSAEAAAPAAVVGTAALTPTLKQQSVAAPAAALDLSNVSFEQAMLKMAASESEARNSVYFHQWITQHAADVTPPQAAKLAYVLIRGYVPSEDFGLPKAGAEND